MVNYESCCASDDGAVFQGFIYDSMRMGYGLMSVKEYIKDYRLDDDEDEDDDE